MNNIQIINTTTGEIIGFASGIITVKTTYNAVPFDDTSSTNSVSGQMKVERVDTSMIVDEICEPDVKKPNAKEALRDFLQTKQRRPSTKKARRKKRR